MSRPSSMRSMLPRVRPSEPCTMYSSMTFSSGGHAQLDRADAGDDGSERLTDAVALRRGGQAGEDAAEARLAYARDDVLPAIGGEKGRARALDVLRRARAGDGAEVLGIGPGLHLQQPVYRAGERDQVVHRTIPRRVVELRVLAPPLQLVQDRVLRLLLPVKQEHVLPQLGERAVGLDARAVVRLSEQF